MRGIPLIEFCQEGLYESCQKGKSKGAIYRSISMSSITEPLQLIHMDLFGPVKIMFMSRKRYAIVMVEDFYKYTWYLFFSFKRCSTSADH